jgi:hypothetical protein
MQIKTDELCCDLVAMRSACHCKAKPKRLLNRGNAIDRSII